MKTPLVTEGRFDLGPDGALIRHQLKPRKETIEIGERFVTVRREEESYENLVPIPSGIAPLLSLLRTILVAPDAQGGWHDARFTTSDTGWIVAIANDGIAGALTIRGCGDILRGIGIALPGGERRNISFVSAQ